MDMPCAKTLFSQKVKTEIPASPPKKSDKKLKNDELMRQNKKEPTARRRLAHREEKLNAYRLNGRSPIEDRYSLALTIPSIHMTRIM